MDHDRSNMAAGDDTNPRRLFVYNGGFLTQRRLKRILHLSGYKVSIGRPQKTDFIGIWGNSPTAHRGQKMAERTGAGVVNVEDTFLRSLFPGRTGEPPVGLFIDHKGAHFDPAQPSDLETILKHDPLDDTVLLNRARAAIERIKEAHLSKYSAYPVDAPCPDPGYVLVIDQTRGDAAVTASGANDNWFQEMLVLAQEENPGAPILIKTHPETQQGFRSGYFSETDETDRVKLWDTPISPWTLFEGATRVYTVSSQMGFEAIFAGHKPRVFGQPCYAGWGLTEDERPLYRRQRNLTRAQLFAGVMMVYPKWYSTAHDCLCELEDVIDDLEAKARAWREDHRGWNAIGTRLWKRRHFQQFFGAYKPVRFKSPKVGRRDMVWGATTAASAVTRVEDGFLRSKGLGADLIPPLSLACDDLGIYYDPSSESRLERLIAKRATLREDQRARAAELRQQLVALGLSKYNLGGDLPNLPEGRRILVPGQVEDDQSILLGATDIRTNAALLEKARAENPDAVIIYKPHPDVVAGLRNGAVENTDRVADLVLETADTASLLQVVDEVWTMTSLTGFEALLRGVKVTTVGVPFYAGWGLTTDLAEIPMRREAKPSLDGLVHAALIDYPRYFDPVTKSACSVEVVVNRLTEGVGQKRSAFNRITAKAQGIFAGYAHLWR